MVGARPTAGGDPVHRRLRSIACLLAALSLVAGAQPGAAEEAAPGALARVVASGKLRIGMSGAQPPLNFEGKSGDVMGLEVDLARALARLMGVELQIVEKPFAELLDALAEGKVDAVMSGMTATPERSLRAAFVGPYYLSGKSILTRSAAIAQADEMADLNRSELELAALAGSTSEQFVRKQLPKATLESTPSYDDAVKLLLAGKVDALVADREILALTALLHPKEGLATLPETLTIEPIGIAVPAGDAAFVHYLQNATAALEGSGVLGVIRSRWLERGDWVQQLP
jgi:ABC-type amino acid transport substrate-binding protein